MSSALIGCSILHATLLMLDKLMTFQDVLYCLMQYNLKPLYTYF